MKINLPITHVEKPWNISHGKYIVSKTDLKGAIPVIMHSSLSADANMVMGKGAGVDAYVAKFNPVVLASTLRPFLARMVC